MQLLVKYALFEPFGVSTSLNGLGITILILATVCIAAAGNIINDIYDIETDTINKPEKVIVGKSVSEKNAYTLFIAFNLIGVGLGYYVSSLVDRSAFFSIFVLISALLYMYASYLKPMLIIGNIVISALVAFSILIVGLFELMPAITSFNKEIQFSFFRILLDYALFAFSINLLREIAKDIEDIDGDHKAGMNTLPIIIGSERAKNVLISLNFIPLAFLIHYIVFELYRQPIAVGYFLLLVIGPLIYITIKIFSASTKKDFKHISNTYKLVLFSGMLSLLLYKYVILK